MRRNLIGFVLIAGIVLGVAIDSYNLSHPETFESHFVYEAKAEEPEVVQLTTKIDWTPERIDTEIEEQAAKYGKSADYMRAIIKCESHGSTTIQSHHVKNGVREKSYGLSQIHLPSHPTVTREEAIDPEFAINFLAKNLGKVKWSCEDMI